MLQKNFPNQQGYIVLFSVILLSVIGVAVAGSLILLALAHSQTNFILQQSARSAALADACAESALDSLRQNPGYAGGQAVNLNTGSCSILPVLLNGSEYTVETEAGVNGVIRKVEIQAQWQSGPPAATRVDSWREAGDFN